MGGRGLQTATGLFRMTRLKYGTTASGGSLQSGLGGSSDALNGLSDKARPPGPAQTSPSPARSPPWLPCLRP